MQIKYDVDKELTVNDDWNWFQNRNGDNAKLRMLHITVYKDDKNPEMFSLKFSGKRGYRLRGGFWVTKEDFLDAMKEVFEKEGYSVTRR